MSFRRLTLLVAAIAALAACEREAPMPDREATPSRSDGAIVFGVQKPEATKASRSIDQAALQALGFGVFACHTGELTYETTSVQPNFMYNQAVSYASSAWSYEPVKYWPQAQDNISFFAYAPYESSPATDKCIAAFSPVDALGDPWLLYKLAPEMENQVDLLYGVKAENGAPWLDVKRQNAAVNFSFRHALACIGDEITIQGSSELLQMLEAAGQSLTITGISVTYSNLTTKGRLVLNSTNIPRWEPVVSGELTCSRTITHTSLSLAVTSSSQILSSGEGLFYIPFTHSGQPAQRADITVSYTYKGVPGSTSGGFELSETVGANEPIVITISQDLSIFPSVTMASATLPAVASPIPALCWSTVGPVQLYSGSSRAANLHAVSSSNPSALSGKTAHIFTVDDPVTLYYPAKYLNYSGQNGSADNLANYSYLTAASTVTAVDEGAITLGNASLALRQAYWMLDFEDATRHIPVGAEMLSIWTDDETLLVSEAEGEDPVYGTSAAPLVVSPLSNSVTTFYVAINDNKAASHTYNFRILNDDIIYTGTYDVPDNAFTNGALTQQETISLTGTYAPEYDYLTLEALADGTTVTFKNRCNSQGNTNVYYSVDKGVNWLPIAYGADGVISLSAGEKVQFKGDNYNYGFNGSKLSADKDCYLYGNIMSLIDSEGFPAQTVFEGNAVFDGFFNTNNSSHLLNHPIKDLVLPATTLTYRCYRWLFYGCTGLTRAPALPATALTQQCYESMFEGCTSLTTAPALPATELTQQCYASMFKGCTALAAMPALPATSLAQACYSKMFSGCTSLATVVSLPSTTLAQACYLGMFSGCSGLTTLPATLPAETLMPGCYQLMFEGCTSITTMPVLSATALDTYCCKEMFKGCTSLTTLVPLPATTLANNCYQDMFMNCTALTSIPNNLLPATSLTPYCYSSMFMGCSNLTAAPAIPATALASGSCESMFEWCSHLTSAPSFSDVVTIGNRGCYRMFYGCGDLVSVSSSMFSSCSSVDVSACEQMFQGCYNMTSGPARLAATTLANKCYYSMFAACRELTSSPELPATTLANECYAQMFYGCYKLSTASSLPATVLAEGCYKEMFRKCTTLTTAPDLNAETLVTNCYRQMFYESSKLNYVKCLATNVNGTSNYTYQWLYSVANSGTFVTPSETNWLNNNGGIPSGWTRTTP